jgi:hypothetical protein
LVVGSHDLKFYIQDDAKPYTHVSSVKFVSSVLYNLDERESLKCRRVLRLTNAAEYYPNSELAFDTIIPLDI